MPAARGGLFEQEKRSKGSSARKGAAFARFASKNLLPQRQQGSVRAPCKEQEKKSRKTRSRSRVRGGRRDVDEPVRPRKSAWWTEEELERPLRLPANRELLGYLERIRTELRTVVSQKHPMIPPDHLLDEPRCVAAGRLLKKVVPADEDADESPQAARMQGQDQVRGDNYIRRSTKNACSGWCQSRSRSLSSGRPVPEREDVLAIEMPSPSDAARAYEFPDRGHGRSARDAWRKLEAVQCIDVASPTPERALARSRAPPVDDVRHWCASLRGRNGREGIDRAVAEEEELLEMLHAPLVVHGRQHSSHRRDLSAKFAQRRRLLAPATRRSSAASEGDGMTLGSRDGSAMLCGNVEEPLALEDGRVEQQVRHPDVRRAAEDRMERGGQGWCV